MIDATTLARIESLDAGEGVTFTHISNDAYHRGIGLSHSGAKRLLRTPYHYHALQAAEREVPPKTPTPQMLNGTLVHCALLEPDEFTRRYLISSTDDKRSAEWKRLAHQAEETGRQLITNLQCQQAFAQANRLRELPDVAALLRTGAPEVSVYWRDMAHGMLLKCRPDWVSPVGHGDGAILLDVKTTSDASRDAFMRSVNAFGYHTQADWYCDGYAVATGLEVHGMLFAVVESEYPHACTPYMLSDAALTKARERNAKARAIYAACLKANDWPSYPREIQVLDLPAWAD